MLGIFHLFFKSCRLGAASLASRWNLGNVWSCFVCVFWIWIPSPVRETHRKKCIRFVVLVSICVGPYICISFAPPILFDSWTVVVCYPGYFNIFECFPWFAGLVCRYCLGFPLTCSLVRWSRCKSSFFESACCRHAPAPAPWEHLSRLESLDCYTILRDS